ncbi:bifunctional 3-(3-hydroxy-phenyl)propionate/3-hydroxycinnamic acid hydroxylase [Sphingopyxis granuli]|nr:bifunctional 3-(3-hydroxy-phenyl)propionate/3-hydroxycinnamic acid hydroxylase [Sphingopyxis granuli]
MVKRLPELASAYDAVVIGAGPVGALAANLLGREGLSTLALDVASEPYNLPRAIVIDDVSLRLLQPLGVPDAIAGSIADYRASEYRDASGALLRRIVQPSAPYPLSWPPYVSFVQPHLEAALHEAMRSCSAIDLGLGLRAHLADVAKDGIRLRVEDVAAGTSREISGKYLLGCDGAKSALRDRLGITLEDLQFDEPWLVVDVLLVDSASLPEINIQNCDPARPSTYVRGPGKLRRWEFMLLPGEDPAVMARDENVWRLLVGQLRPDQGRIWRAATYRFHALVANQWRKGDIFLLGDAAHQTPPFMGQGLNQGLRDAGNLCWKIAEVVQGRAANDLLDSYEIERRPMTRDVIETAKQLGRVICVLDEAAAAERNRRMKEEVRQGRGEVVRQDLIPSTLSEGFLMRQADGTPAPGAGRVFPQPWVVSDGVRGRLDDRLAPGFVLITRPDWFPDATVQAKADKLNVRFATFGGGGAGVQAVREEDGLIARWMRDLRVDAVLVRPDHFVFGGASGAEPEAALVTALAEALRPQR